MPSSTTIARILWRYKKREELTQEELRELKSWLRESPDNEKLFDDLSNTAKWDKEIEKWQSVDPNANWDRIRKKVEEISPGTFKKKTGWIRYGMAAAAIIIALTVILWWQLRKQSRSEKVISELPKPVEIMPSSSTAILKLGDGSVIQLNGLQTGTVAKQGAANIIKTDSAALNYQAPSNSNENSEYNILSTPKGSQYSVVLADGSKIWLNAASTLRFPASFTGNVREVELNGEAYFEVAHDKQKPFIVKTGHSVSVRVLGTHFNVNAYADEVKIKTDLLEGSVSVSNGRDSAVIKPGQEATLNEKEFAVTTANLEEVTAWRNKIFWYKNAPFDEIMRELSRWYDMDVVYEGKINQSYTGILPTNLPLSNVLKLLEKGGNVHFTIEEGNKVKVQP